MKLNHPVFMAIALALGSAVLASADIIFTCDPTINALGPANTCATLNTTISGLYAGVFSNANANIYIQYGNTGLGESTTGFLNLIPYSTYRSDLIASNGPGAVRAGAIASLAATEPAIFNGGEIEVTSALGAALGIPNASLLGTTANGNPCTPGTAGCYNGIVTLATPSDLPAGQGYYYRNGSQSADQYDFYSVVEHETDEVLGTSSCIRTIGSLSDGCTDSTASAVDLYRYQSAGNGVFISTTPGAYFSYNGGATNGADGADYNTLAIGDDYADFTTSCQHVQDETGCLGKSFDITNDGGPEINILDAVGYNLLPAATSVPEPSAFALAGAALAVFGWRRRSRSRAEKKSKRLHGPPVRGDVR